VDNGEIKAVGPVNEGRGMGGSCIERGAPVELFSLDRSSDRAADET